MSAAVKGLSQSNSAAVRRNWLMGGLFLLAGLFVIGLFALRVGGDEISTFRFSGGGDPVKLPEFPVPTQLVNLTLGAIITLTGLYHLVRGFARANLVLGLNFFLLVVAFLTWSIRGASLNVTGLLESTLLRATPFLLGALSGILCERSGVINIAIEGMMLLAAFISVIVTNLTGGNLWLV